ncbi:DUF2726 domain-containing protein [Hyphomicrobium sp.]|uniref:DUF2726 domain-containing protein n=1 Tax=Hyphomicrobium sp. TaxID=82 RepID=UPI000FAAA9C4|nr:DUF2726 domain-containing protein [Hyphomicrobium sp.]RUO97552.1 MAG: DUF2726 domain-containing protein [Hyphomicrobium sp.]
MPSGLHSLLGWLLGVALALFVAWLLLRRRSAQPPNGVSDPKKQLEFVSRVEFERQPLINKSEFQVLLVLEEVVRSCGRGHRVMAQTVLGEFLRPKPGGGAEADLAYRSINSKRADFVVVDSRGYAVLVVEYQGSGHYQGTANLRDAVKREAFRTAGLTLLEVMPGFSKADVAARVRQALGASGVA